VTTKAFYYYYYYYHQRFSVFYNTFRRTWPSSGSTQQVWNTFEETISISYYKKKRNPGTRALLGYYAAVAIPYGRFGTTYRSHLHDSADLILKSRGWEPIFFT